MKITGSGTTAGFNASALLTLLRNRSRAPRVNFGFVYRSQSDLPLNGELSVNSMGGEVTIQSAFPGQLYRWARGVASARPGE